MDSEQHDEIRPNAVYTVSEVCQLLRLSDATVRRLLRRGHLRGGRVGRAYRILGSHLLEALAGLDQQDRASR